jgi:hypothetical protein
MRIIQESFLQRASENREARPDLIYAQPTHQAHCSKDLVSANVDYTSRYGSRTLIASCLQTSWRGMQQHMNRYGRPDLAMDRCWRPDYRAIFIKPYARLIALISSRGSLPAPCCGEVSMTFQGCG